MKSGEESPYLLNSCGDYSSFRGKIQNELETL
jgi:hypothetical protein